MAEAAAIVAPGTPPPATDADGNLLLSAAQATLLLQQSFVEFKAGLVSLVRVSIETTNDLFDMNEFVSDTDAQDFRAKREEWVERFEKVLGDLFEKRLAGKRRQGRRPDFDASLATLRVLNAFDHEKQAALTSSTMFLRRLTKRELDALDLRIGVLLRETRVRGVDNPFSPDYVLDAIGVSSRAVYPNPRIWRPLMERMLSDVTMGINKTLIKVNRFLADQQVLPEIKAQLRARSELRPIDDSELLTTFQRMFKEASPREAEALLALDIAVPDASASTPSSVAPFAPSAGAYGVVAGAPAGPAAGATAGTAAATTAGARPAAVARPAREAMAAANDLSPPTVSGPETVGGFAPSMSPETTRAISAMAAQLNPYIADLARALPPVDTAKPAETNAFGLPQLDPLMALGSLSAAISVLDRWQRLDPGYDPRALPVSTTDAAPLVGEPGAPQAAASLNRIPFIRAAIGDKVVNSTDKITMDVINLLFDYIFGDPSIPEELRSLFSKLQVPILKTALVDRTFFSDRKHPARRVLDHLAAAAIGATGDAGYRASFELTAAGVIDQICRDFNVDVAVFDLADARLLEFTDTEQRKAEGALDTEVAAALAAETNESDRAQVRALIRDKLAGIQVPFAVRSFGETTWADYLTNVRMAQGTSGEEWRTGVQTLDDLLWSLTSKERAGQKARLAKLVPGMIRNLRKGAAAVQVGDERVKPLLDSMYQMHMAAIKPPSANKSPTAKEKGAAAGTPGGNAVGKIGTRSAADGDTVAPTVNGDTPTISGDTRGGDGANENTDYSGGDTGEPSVTNIHDFVGEMVVGTWIEFGRGDKAVSARLTWVSPLRSKYIFTSRSRSRAIVITPEELAWRIGAKKARLIVEPVPLFDRAVSAALDTLAAQKQPSTPAEGAVAATH